MCFFIVYMAKILVVCYSWSIQILHHQYHCDLLHKCEYQCITATRCIHIKTSVSTVTPGVYMSIPVNQQCHLVYNVNTSVSAVPPGANMSIQVYQQCHLVYACQYQCISSTTWCIHVITSVSAVPPSVYMSILVYQQCHLVYNVNTSVSAVSPGVYMSIPVYQQCHLMYTVSAH